MYGKTDFFYGMAHLYETIEKKCSITLIYSLCAPITQKGENWEGWEGSRQSGKEVESKRFDIYSC